ncbi:MAG: CDP-glycerol glycerophosphotransferase family protein [Anaerovoracaceae bacterium]
MKTIKSIIKNIAKRNEFTRRIGRKVLRETGSSKYSKLAEKIPVDPKLVVFESYMGRQYACTPKAVYEEMIKDPYFDDYKFVWFFKDPKKYTDVDSLKRANLVEYGKKEYLASYAKAGYAVTNSNILDIVRKKENQIFIQTWHGTPLKRLRCDIINEGGSAVNSLREIREKNDIDIVRYDYFLSPSKFASEKFTSAFNLKNLGMEDIILEIGYPRNDFLFNYTKEDVAAIKNRLGLGESNKKLILYAPTFRDNQHDLDKGYVYQLDVDFARLKETLGDDYIILFRPHYFIANQFDFGAYKGFVVNVADIDDINELYIISDMLITDYSSVFFDYANLKRPILFYMHDLEEYDKQIRGFYLSLETLPRKILRTEEELISEIKNEEFVYDKRYEEFSNRFNSLDDGQAAKRLVRMCFKGEK